MIKLKSYGTLDHYKTQLAALGYKQEYGIDYSETFSPINKMTTVRNVLSITTSQSWPFFSNGGQSYMRILKTKSICIYQVTPRLLKKFKGIVSRMHCSLYGLKQVPRARFDQFYQTVKKAEFQQSSYNPFMSLHQSSTKLTLLYTLMITSLQEIILTVFTIFNSLSIHLST